MRLDKLFLQVSVPFRGSCSEIVLDEFASGVQVTPFPSPFGVHVLKLTVICDSATTSTFPSPFGVHVLKSARRAGERKGAYYGVSVPFRGSRSEIAVWREHRLTLLGRFPSPFGVHVLKYEKTAIQGAITIMFPSPFGVHVLKCVGVALDKGYIPSVSVPFRGSRSEIKLLTRAKRAGVDSFRPLSGFTF